MPSRLTLPTPRTLSARIKGARASDPPVTDRKEWGDWVTVSSSNIAAVRYNLAESSLEIRFRGGRVYRYSSVTLNAYESLLSAPSKGRYVRRSIVGIYPSYRV